MADSFENIKLVIGKELKGAMERRLIAVEDVQKVIEYAERTGKKLVNQETGHFLARFQPVSVTYRVEYAPYDEEDFRVFNVQVVDSFENSKLVIGKELKEAMERRLILVEDIQKVIEYAERTGKKLVNQETGHFLAYFQPANVTYWVEYAAVEDGLQVFNAYSHRMQIAGDRGSASVSDPKSPAREIWQCFKCRVPLEPGTVTVTYLDNEFPVRLPKCSGCGLVFVPPDLAMGKMQEVEMALEDK